MSIFEYNEEEEMKKIRADEFSVGKEAGKIEGKAEGKAEGILEGKMQVYRNLLKKGFTEKEAREITEIS